MGVFRVAGVLGVLQQRVVTELELGYGSRPSLHSWFCGHGGFGRVTTFGPIERNGRLCWD